MTTEELRAVLEGELAWRIEDLIFFKNQLVNIYSVEEKDKYRKSLVMILYSHLEGFIKISLLSYVQYLNSLGLERKAFNENLLASSMETEFKAYETKDIKCKVFKKGLPEETKLHRFYRRVHFLENLREFENTVFNIKDTTIDTESNLWYIVLQKNMFKVGLPVDLFSEYQRDIDALVNRRNALSHGTSKDGIDDKEYSDWEKKVLTIMEEVMRQIYLFAKRENYLKEVYS
ncbi:MAE_28990/MAE_18760 family HEPN-like nuclease [Kineothrix sedimenti]|uniref:MAE_28990/MAE_18760 family HEPN-like nuclease n=1 Tax=Kineothrix sedimenti TaxID=3123317 RepID=A0ABZ3EZP5_9FIRM